jgi:mannose-6-phosphate isomerase-like protein (cupin superfamily)
MPLPAKPTAIAPDGSDVRVLLRLDTGSMIHISLAAGRTSSAVTHRSVDEIWYILTGSGEMWRSQAGRSEVVRLEPGLCLTIPLGTHFQFRASPSEALIAVATTIPLWPGDNEALAVPGPW